MEQSTERSTMSERPVEEEKPKPEFCQKQTPNKNEKVSPAIQQLKERVMKENKNWEEDEETKSANSRHWKRNRRRRTNTKPTKHRNKRPQTTT